MKFFFVSLKSTRHSNQKIEFWWNFFFSNSGHTQCIMKNLRRLIKLIKKSLSLSTQDTLKVSTSSKLDTIAKNVDLSNSQ